MAPALAVLMVGVVAYCLARAFVPALRDPEHRRDLDLWHVVMGLGMAGMLLLTITATAAVVGVAVFVLGAGWAVVRGALPGRRAAYLPLGVGSLAMTAMLLPLASAPAAAATPSGHHAHTHAVAGAGLVPPPLLVLALLVALGAVVVVRLVASLRPGVARPARWDAGCDVAMAAAMASMLVALV